MSDRICTKCGAGTPIGCFLCNPEVYPRDGSFDLQVRIDQQRETIGRLTDEADGYRDRIRELKAENKKYAKRIRAYQDRVDTLGEAVADYCVEWCEMDQTKALINRAEAAESKLLAVEELPGKWREKYAPVVKSDGPVWRAAANELDALLKEEVK